MGNANFLRKRIAFFYFSILSEIGLGRSSRPNSSSHNSSQTFGNHFKSLDSESRTKNLLRVCVGFVDNSYTNALSIVSVKSGSSSNSATPYNDVDFDFVDIVHTHFEQTVIYDRSSTAVISCILENGTFKFDPLTSTHLQVGIIVTVRDPDFGMFAPCSSTSHIAAELRTRSPSTLLNRLVDERVRANDGSAELNAEALFDGTFRQIRNYLHQFNAKLLESIAYAHGSVPTLLPICYTNVTDPFVNSRRSRRPPRKFRMGVGLPL